jgi:transposase InsO family protein
MAMNAEEMNAEEKIARQRLSVLQLAEALSNASEACRRRGMARTQFYEYKRRFELQGLDGLKDLPPIHETHPQTTAPAVVEKLLALSLQHPAWGCVRLCAHLKLDGVSVSSPTIQHILIKHGMASTFDRLMKLEAKAAGEPIGLSAEQIIAIEKANPCFKERHVESGRPGELLCQDTFFVGTFKGVGKVYLHTVVDTYGSYAFGFLHTSTVPEAAVAVLHNDVLPFYRERGIPLGKVLTDNGRGFCGTEAHPYELSPALTDLAHKRTKVRHPQTNGFVERFHRTAKEEFFEVALRETFYETVEALQTDWDRWLAHYNTERPHLGYRNRGKRPIDTINAYLNVRQEAS